MPFGFPVVVVGVDAEGMAAGIRKKPPPEAGVERWLAAVENMASEIEEKEVPLGGGDRFSSEILEGRISLVKADALIFQMADGRSLRRNIALALFGIGLL